MQRLRLEGSAFAGKPKWSFTEVAEILLKELQWAKESVKPLSGRDNVHRLE
jgi:hypothetical protein